MAAIKAIRDLKGSKGLAAQEFKGLEGSRASRVLLASAHKV